MNGNLVWDGTSGVRYPVAHLSASCELVRLTNLSFILSPFLPFSLSLAIPAFLFIFGITDKKKILDQIVFPSSRQFNREFNS